MSEAKMTDMGLERVALLRVEAGAAGDADMVAACDRAIDGDTAAWAECVRVIRDAEGR